MNNKENEKLGETQSQLLPAVGYICTAPGLRFECVSCVRACVLRCSTVTLTNWHLEAYREKSR